MTDEGRSGNEQGGEAPCYAHLLDPLTEMSISTPLDDATESAVAEAVAAPIERCTARTRNESNFVIP